MVKNCNCLLSFQVEIESKSEVNLYSSVCSLWRSDIYEIPLSRPISPLIVQESARLSPNDIEIIIILCKKKKIASIFQRLFRIYFVLVYEYGCAQGRPSNQKTPRLDLKRILSVARLELERIFYLIIINQYSWFRFFPDK